MGLGYRLYPSYAGYDTNGNLVSDGVNTYTWNARDELVAISGAVIASFAYDALGRRISKSIAGVETKYLYNGLNMVQELSNGSPTADLLTGLGIDEIFSRTDANGARHFLIDALGSWDPHDPVYLRALWEGYGVACRMTTRSSILAARAMARACATTGCAIIIQGYSGLSRRILSGSRAGLIFMPMLVTIRLTLSILLD
jgi:hypothetical protein